MVAVNGLEVEYLSVTEAAAVRLAELLTEKGDDLGNAQPLCESVVGATGEQGTEAAKVATNKTTHSPAHEPTHENDAPKDPS